MSPRYAKVGFRLEQRRLKLVGYKSNISGTTSKVFNMRSAFFTDRMHEFKQLVCRHVRTQHAHTHTHTYRNTHIVLMRISACAYALSW